MNNKIYGSIIFTMMHLNISHSLEVEYHAQYVKHSPFSQSSKVIYI